MDNRALEMTAVATVVATTGVVTVSRLLVEEILAALLAMGSAWFEFREGLKSKREGQK